jgi:hypothetical protein
MKTQLKLILLSLLSSVTISGFSQEVSIVSNKFVVNGNSACPIYFNGSNNPWESWNDFGGTYNVATWKQDMVNLKNKNINSARIWFSCNGQGQPSISSSGVASAPTQAFWNNCDSLFSSAKANGVYIMATLMSFDHTKTANPNAANWQAMLNSQANVQTYVDNYVVPFVNRYKTNPYLWSIDICNEIEWIYENGGTRGDGTNWSGSSYAILQRFVAMNSAGIHNNPRTDGTTVLATVGSACVKWNGTLLPTGKTNPDGNKWSDANLKAQYNQANAILDFYSPHYYGWMEPTYSSPFEKSPAQFGMSEKPCVVGEMPARDPLPAPDGGTNGISLTTAFNNLKTLGWQGHQPWTANITTGLTTEVGDLSDFGPAAQTFYNNNKTLVKPVCTVTAVQGAASIEGITCYPNPFSDNVTVNVPGQFSYELYDLSGSKLSTGSATGTTSLGNNVPSGTYILKVYQDEKISVLKITKN